MGLRRSPRSPFTRHECRPIHDVSTALFVLNTIGCQPVSARLSWGGAIGPDNLAIGWIDAPIPHSPRPSRWSGRATRRTRLVRDDGPEPRSRRLPHLDRLETCPTGRCVAVDCYSTGNPNEAVKTPFSSGIEYEPVTPKYLRMASNSGSSSALNSSSCSMPWRIISYRASITRS